MSLASRCSGMRICMHGHMGLLQHGTDMAASCHDGLQAMMVVADIMSASKRDCGDGGIKVHPPLVPRPQLNHVEVALHAACTANPPTSEPPPPNQDKEASIRYPAFDSPNLPMAQWQRHKGIHAEAEIARLSATTMAGHAILQCKQLWQ